MNFAVNIASFSRLAFWKISQIHWKTTLFESLFYKDAGLWPATLLKMTSAQVFSCKFWEIFENIFYTEHLRTTASAIPWKYRHINPFWELVFSKYLLNELLLLILCWSFKPTWSSLRNTVPPSHFLKLFLNRDSDTLAFYKLYQLSGRLLLSNAKNVLN